VTITEANEFATVLRAFLNVKDDLLGRKSSCAQQIEAAQYLCHRASKALQLQIMSDSEIAQQWPRRNDPADPTSWDAEMIARYNAVDPTADASSEFHSLSLLDRVTNSGIRVESIVSFPLAGEESPSDQAVDAVEDILDSSNVWLPAEMHKLAAKLERIRSDDDSSIEALLEAGFDGYWVNVAHPVLAENGVRRDYPNFGLYNSRWFYADSIDQALEGALEWAETRQTEAAKLPAKGDQ
jgi:hypothetical protein